jgi:hypothetical protein
LKTCGGIGGNHAPFIGGLRYAFFLALAHRAITALRARLVRAAAVMVCAVFSPPACPRHAGQYFTTTSSVSTWIEQCSVIGITIALLRTKPQ